MPRGKNCRETIFAAQLPRNCGVILKEETFPLLWGRGSLGGHLRENLDEGNRESKIAARQWGVKFCREASKCLARRSGKDIPWCFECFQLFFSVFLGMQLFCLQLEASCLQWSFFTYS